MVVEKIVTSAPCPARVAKTLWETRAGSSAEGSSGKSFPPGPGGDTRNMAWGVGFSSPQRSRRLFYTERPPYAHAGGKESGMRMPKQTRTQTLDENKRKHWRCLAEAPARPSATAPGAGSRLATKSCRAPMAAPARAPPLYRGTSESPADSPISTRVGAWRVLTP